MDGTFPELLTLYRSGLLRLKSHMVADFGEDSVNKVLSRFFDSIIDESVDAPHEIRIQISARSKEKAEEVRRQISNHLKMIDGFKLLANDEGLDIGTVEELAEYVRGKIRE